MNYDQMVLQVDDVYDMLVIKYPHYYFLLMLDQSSGHGKMREDALNANSMSVRWGGKQQIFPKKKLEKSVLARDPWILEMSK